MAGAKEQKWFGVAQDLVVLKGCSYAQVQQHIANLGDSVSLGTLSHWAQKGDWQGMRKRWLQTNRGLAPDLKKQVTDKLQAMIATDGPLDLKATQLAVNLLGKIERLDDTGPSFKVLALEVMAKFAEYSREHCDDAATLEDLGGLIGGFLNEVGRQA